MIAAIPLAIHFITEIFTRKLVFSSISLITGQTVLRSKWAALRDWIILLLRVLLFAGIAFGLYQTLTDGEGAFDFGGRRHRMILVQDDVQTLLSLAERHSDPKGIALISSLCREENVIYTISTTSGYVVCKEQEAVAALKSFKVFWDKHYVGSSHAIVLPSSPAELAKTDEIIVVASALTAPLVEAMRTLKKVTWISTETIEMPACAVYEVELSIANNMLEVAPLLKGECKGKPTLVLNGKQLGSKLKNSLGKENVQFGAVSIINSYNVLSDKLFHFKEKPLRVYTNSAAPPVEAFLKNARGVQKSATQLGVDALILDRPVLGLDTLALSSTKRNILVLLSRTNTKAWRSFFITSQVEIRELPVLNGNAGENNINLAQTRFLRNAYRNGNMGTVEIAAPPIVNVTGEGVEPLLITNTGNGVFYKVNIGSATYYLLATDLLKSGEQLSKSEIFVPMLYSALARTAEAQSKGALTDAQFLSENAQARLDRLQVTNMPAAYNRDNGLAAGYFKRTRNNSTQADTVAVNLGSASFEKTPKSIPASINQRAYSVINTASQANADLFGNERVASWLFMALIAIALLEVFALLLKR